MTQASGLPPLNSCPPQYAGGFAVAAAFTKIFQLDFLLAQALTRLSTLVPDLAPLQSEKEGKRIPFRVGCEGSYPAGI